MAHIVVLFGDTDGLYSPRIERPTVTIVTDAIQEDALSSHSQSAHGYAPSPAALRVGRRYRPSRIAEQYDAIVIGSGPGGLSTAVCLSKMGWKVAVLEQHYTAGGFTHAYGRQGYEWDVGVHYIGDMGSSKTMAKQLYDFLSDNQLQWAPMGNPYDTVFIGDFKFEFPPGENALKAALITQFPTEEDALNQYFDLLRTVSRGMSSFALGKILPFSRLFANHAWLRKRLPAAMFEPTLNVLQGLTQNKRLIAVLTTQWGDAGVTPRDSSFLIHAIIARHYLHGGFYPIGGASMIARTQIPAIQQTGGDVFTYAEVSNIVLHHDQVQGVAMSDGHVIKAPIVVSSAGVFNTFTTLLPSEVAQQHGYADALENVTPSMAHIGLYLGFKHSAQALNLPKTNFWIYLDDDHDAAVDRFKADKDAPIPLIYVSFPSAKDPSWDVRYPDRATIEIVSGAQYEWFKPWEDTTWAHRGAEYEALKEAFAGRLLQALYKKLPQLEGKLDYWELSTPLSTQHFNHYGHGEIYGLNHDPKRFEQNWLKPKTKIKGLYLTGQDTLTCGVVGAAMSGVLTAVAILGFWRGIKLWKTVSRFNKS